METKQFNIKVGNEEYCVKELQSYHPRRYRIETGCNYLFTIHETEFNGWLVDDLDVVPITEDLPGSIGEQIRLHEEEARQK